MNIDISNLNFEYEKGKRILSEISLRIGSGESVGLIGVNGVGKSTLLKILVGLNTDFTGEAKIGETELTTRTIREIRKK